MYTKFHLDVALNGSKNMDIDGASFHRFNTSDFSEGGFFSVRVYEWAGPTISLGIAQAKRDIFNEQVEADGIKVVPRITGGRVVLHHQEITYSVIGPINGLFGFSLHDSYQTISNILVVFLKKLGISPDMMDMSKNNQPTKNGVNFKNRSLSCYDALGFKEISLGGKKLIGSAQKRGKIAFLQHGSIPFCRHEYRLENYLKVQYRPRKRESDSYIFINDFVEFSIVEAKELLLDTFKQEINKLSSSLREVKETSKQAMRV